MVFDGDSYDPKWHEEAQKRGLPHLRTTVDALAALKTTEALNLFAKYGVLNNRELRARADVLQEQYNTTVGIEARTMICMINKHVLPAAVRSQTELAESVAATQAVGVECDATRAQLQELVEMITELRAATEAGRDAEVHTLSSTDRQGKYIRDKLVPAMARARAAADALEMITPDDLWTLPTYTEMLFMR